MNKDYLSRKDAQFQSAVAVLAHELWHTEQPGLDRYSTWGEIDAYSLQYRVLEEFNLPPFDYLPAAFRDYDIELQGNRPGNTPRDADFLCKMREALLELNNPVYNNEPLFYVGYVPVIAQWCPNTGGPRRINPATGQPCTLMDEYLESIHQNRSYCIDIYES